MRAWFVDLLGKRERHALLTALTPLNDPVTLWQNCMCWIAQAEGCTESEAEHVVQVVLNRWGQEAVNRENTFRMLDALRVAAHEMAGRVE